MYAITGITGQVGSAVASNLLDAGQAVRAVVRDTKKGAVWKDRGCHLALAEMTDAAALTAAFEDMDAVFLLIPPVFDPAEGFPEVKEVIAALTAALEKARPKRVVSLSTIGAQATRSNLLSQHTLVEKALSALPMPVTFLRPGWFMENSAWDIGPAREKGVMPSFLQPLDKAFPLVAVEDIGTVAARLLQEEWSGVRLVELEGPVRITPNSVADAFASILGKPVHAEVVARESWKPLFLEQGMKNPEPRMRMLDGFNEGWIDFEGGEGTVLKGRTDFETALRRLIAR